MNDETLTTAATWVARGDDVALATVVRNESPERSSSRTIGTKSLPSAPRPCIQITAASGCSLVLSSTVSRWGRAVMA